jgi:hypothetical protein
MKILPLLAFAGVAAGASLANAVEPAPPELAPKSVKLKMTRTLAKTAVETAVGLFKKSGDFSKLGQALDELDTTGKATTWVDMRGIRKPAKALRHLLAWVGKGHDGAGVKALPISRFVGALGRLNVAITSGVAAHIAPAAKTTNAAFKQMNIDSDVAGFKPTTQKAFTAFIAGQVANVNRLMAQADMTMSEFHDVRKVMRGLYFAVHYSGTGQTTKKMKKLDAVLARIGFDMGEIHNDQEQEMLTGKIGNLDTLRYTMPAKLRSQIEMVMASLDLGES